MRLRQQPRHRPAHDHQRVDRPAGPQGPGRAGRRHLRHLRRHPRHGRQPRRSHGGVPDYLGWSWKSKAGIPISDAIARLPHPSDNLSPGLILCLLYQAAGQADDPPGRGPPAHLAVQRPCTGCDRAGYYEQGDFATEYGSPKCLVKIGCWGPVVKCNVPKRGWLNGIGGCPSVGGICIGCTMPGFRTSSCRSGRNRRAARSTAASGMYGSVIRSLRSVTARTVDKGPKWRGTGRELTTGYRPNW